MRKFIYFLASLLIVVSLVVLSFGAGAIWGARTETGPPLTKTSDDLDLVREVIEIVEREYVSEPKRKELIQGAAAGVVDALNDPYSHYLKKKHFSRVEEETKGFYSGIGIFLGKKNSHIIVQSVIDKTPAFRAGLKTGDFIISVDKKKTQSKTIDEVARMIRGEEGTTVTLEIARPDNSEPFEVSIVREQIKIPNVESKIMEEDIGYIKMRGFNQTTSRDVQKALEELKGKGAKGFILDLRNNPGGLLDQSVELASIFIEKGKIVSVKGRSRQEETYNSFRVSHGGVQLQLYKDPVVVLINGGSASASEIVAGAFKDHKRAELIGEKTFGKGNVQDIIKLPNGDGVLLTIAKYYTPKGASIHNKGIQPDIKIEMDHSIEPGSAEDIQLKKGIEVLKKKIK